MKIVLFEINFICPIAKTENKLILHEHDDI